MAYIGKKPSDITRAIATYDSFTGDGSTTTFTLTQGAASANDITVVVNNVRQEPGTGSKSYTFNGPTSLVFNTAPAASDEIYVINPTQVESIAKAGDISSGVFTGQTELAATRADNDLMLIYDTSAGALRKIQASNVASDLDINSTTALNEQPASGDKFIVYDATAGANRAVEFQYIDPTLTYTNGTATGDGSDTTFTINSGRSVNDVIITVNGFVLVPTADYTISGTTLTFATAPANSAEIGIRYLPLSGTATYTNGTATGDGSTTAFTINSGRSVEDIIVSVNGVTLVPATDYSISGTTLTFATAPAASAEISIRYLRLT
jgi:hypothetical protein